MISQEDLRISLAYASQDPDFKDDYEDYVINKFGGVKTSKEVDIVKEDSRPSFSYRSLHFKLDNDIRNTRATTARPGLTPKLEKSQTTGDASEKDKVFETSPAQPIPVETYRRMGKDPQIAIGTYLLVGMISSLKFTIESDDEEKEEVIKKVYSRHHNSIVRNALRVGIREGFAFGEKVYQRENLNIQRKNVDGETETVFSGPAIGLRGINWIDQLNSISFYKERVSGNIAYITQEQTSGDVKVERNKLAWFAVDQEHSNVFGESRYKNVFPYWYFDKINYQYGFKSLERFGSPHIEARYPNGSAWVDDVLVKNNQVILDAVVNLGRDGLVVLPSNYNGDDNKKTNSVPEWSVEFKEPKNTGIEPFLKWADYSDRKKLQGLGIPDSILATATVSSGNFSEVDAKIDLLLIIAEDLVDQMEDFIRNDVIDSLIDLNFGREGMSEVTFKIDRSGLGRRQILKEILVNMMRIGGSMQGFNMKHWPSTPGLLNELGISASAFADEFAEVVVEEPMEDGSNVAQDAQDDEDSNNIDRPSNPKRETERSTKKADAASSGV